MPNRIELALCDDCMLLEETGDATSFDHHYTEPESTARLSRCEAGWVSLRAQGRVTNDSFDSSEPQLRCSNHYCFRTFAKDEVTFVYDDELDEEVSICPFCSDRDTMVERSDGRDEFSWSECDCCGSTLGGSRTRYALFPRDASDEAPPDVGPVVHHQVAGPAG